jgi:hypothetical protein
MERKKVVDLDLVSELKAMEKSMQYHADLLRKDPFDWSQKLTVQSLEAEIQDLRKAICVTEMQQCG